MKFRSQIYINALVVVLIVLITLLSFKLYKLIQVNQDIEDGIAQIKINKHLVDSYLFDNIRLFEIEGSDPSNDSVRTLDDVYYRFGDINSQMNKAYIYVSSNNCKSCVDYMMSKLPMVNDSLGDSNVILLYHNYSPRQLYVYKTQNHVNNEMYLVEDSTVFANKLSELSKPVIFMTNEQGLIYKIYSPSEDFDYLLKDYLHIIKSTIFSFR